MKKAFNISDGANGNPSVSSTKKSSTNVPGAFCITNDRSDSSLIAAGGSSNTGAQSNSNINQPRFQELTIPNNDNHERKKTTEKRVSADSFEFDPEEATQFTVAIIGAAKSGKSTLIRAIEKFSDRDPIADLKSRGSQSLLNEVQSSELLFVDPDTSQLYRLKLIEVDLATLMKAIKPTKDRIVQTFQWPANLVAPDGVFVVYDVSDRSSFMYIADILHFLGESQTLTSLLGLKVDQREGYRQVNREMGEGVSKLFGVPFTEISTITTPGVQVLKRNAFFGEHGLMTRLTKKFSKRPPAAAVNVPKPVDLKKTPSKAQLTSNLSLSSPLSGRSGTTSPVYVSKGSLEEEETVTRPDNLPYNFQFGIEKGSEHLQFRKIFGDASLYTLKKIIQDKKVELMRSYPQSSNDNPDTAGTIHDPRMTITQAVILQRQMASQKMLTNDQRESSEMDDILGSYGLEDIQISPTRRYTEDNTSPLDATGRSISISLNKKNIITIDDLVDHLSAEKNMDIEFTKIALYAYRKFYTPKELANSLIKRFDTFYNETAVSPTSADKSVINVVQLRICNVFNTWISYYFDQDFNPDGTNGKKLGSIDQPARVLNPGGASGEDTTSTLFDLLVFMEILAARGESHRSLCQKLLEACWNQAVGKRKLFKALNLPAESGFQAYISDFQEIPLSSAVPGTNKYSKKWPILPGAYAETHASNFQEWFLGMKNAKDTPSLNAGISPSVLATVITQMMIRPFVKTDAREWLHYISTSSAKDRRMRISPNIAESVAKGNMISQWVATTILSFTDLKARAFAFSKMVETAWVLYYEHHNMDSAITVITVRLENTRIYVQHKLMPKGNMKTKKSMDDLTPTGTSLDGQEVWEKYLKMNEEFGSSYNYTKYREILEKRKNPNSPATQSPYGSGENLNQLGSFSNLRKGIERLSIRAGLSLRKHSVDKTSASSSRSNNSINEGGAGQRRQLKGLFGSEDKFEEQPPSSPLSPALSLNEVNVSPDFTLLFIPHINLILTDISKLDVSIADYIGTLGVGKKFQSSDRCINWKKYANIYDIIADVKQFQDSSSRFVERFPSFMEQLSSSNKYPVPIHEWILTQEPLSAELLYVRSRELEVDYVASKSTENLEKVVSIRSSPV